MSDEIQVVRYSEPRRKLLSIKGSDNLSVDSHVQPGLTIEDWTDKEFRYPARIISFGLHANIAAGAGNLCGLAVAPFQISQTGSRLYVVEGVLLRSVAATTVKVGICLDNAWGTLATPTATDSRDFLASTFPTFIKHGNLLAPANQPNSLLVGLQAGVGVLLDRTNCSLFPVIVTDKLSAIGQPTFQCIDTTVNNPLLVSVWGYLRDAVESEF